MLMNSEKTLRSAELIHCTSQGEESCIMMKARGKRSSNFPYLGTLHGSAAKFWLHRGEDRKGWGQKGPARKWPIGESGKQNNVLFPRSRDEDTVGSAFKIS